MCAISLRWPCVLLGGLSALGCGGPRSESPATAAAALIGVEQQKLEPTDGMQYDSFGLYVALDGGTALIGAPVHTVGMNFGQGAAYVYVRNGDTWTQQGPTLIAPDGADSDGFGVVALSGDMALIGAPSHFSSQGAVYTFRRSGDTWTQQGAPLVADDGTPQDYFGSAIALSGETAIIGAYNRLRTGVAGQGAAYVFTWNGAAWTQQGPPLMADDEQQNDLFGASIALDGDTVLIGSLNRDHLPVLEAGGAYAFVRNGNTWMQQGPALTAADGADLDKLGSHVALSGDTALLGAFNRTVDGNTQAGAAYVFVRKDGVWTQQGPALVAPDGGPGDFFGDWVAVSGGTALISADQHPAGTTLQQGAVYAFVRSGEAWAPQGSPILSPVVSESTFFGAGVALSGTTALIGAPHLIADGAAYIFTLDCSSDADCAAERYCAADGSCQPRKIAGGNCASSTECAAAAAFCVDGVCCTSACSGQCEACNEPSSPGTCVAVTGAPRGNRQECAGEARCVGATFTPAPACDIDGQCATPAARSCGKYVCNAQSCLSACATSADCAADFVCSNGSCIPDSTGSGGNGSASGGTSGSSNSEAGASGSSETDRTGGASAGSGGRAVAETSDIGTPSASCSCRIRSAQSERADTTPRWAWALMLGVVFFRKRYRARLDMKVQERYGSFELAAPPSDSFLGNAGPRGSTTDVGQGSGKV